VSGLCVPSEEFYSGLVTWSTLEDALKGLREGLPDTKPMSVVAEKTVRDASDQTDPVGRDREKSKLLTSMLLETRQTWPARNETVECNACYQWSQKGIEHSSDPSAGVWQPLPYPPPHPFTHLNIRTFDNIKLVVYSYACTTSSILSHVETCMQVTNPTNCYITITILPKV